MRPPNPMLPVASATPPNPTIASAQQGPGAPPTAFAKAPPAAASGSSGPSAGTPADPALDTTLAREFRDGFDRAQLGSDWSTTANEWRIEGGRLCVQNAHNHPAW